MLEKFRPTLPAGHVLDESVRQRTKWRCGCRVASVAIPGDCGQNRRALLNEFNEQFSPKRSCHGSRARPGTAPDETAWWRPGCPAVCRPLLSFTLPS